MTLTVAVWKPAMLSRPYHTPTAYTAGNGGGEVSGGQPLLTRPYHTPTAFTAGGGSGGGSS
eukprot:scaffold203312_cov23-Tisochrysis_lutea.AAC.1